MKTILTLQCILIVIIIMVLSLSAFAGSQWESEHDQSWEITVTDCRGNVSEYHDCLIVNDGLSFITFMPNQGKMGTGKGKIVKIYRSLCTEVIMTVN